MNAGLSFERLLAEPVLAGFSLLKPAGPGGPPPSWVLEASCERDAAETKSGDILVLGPAILAKPAEKLAALCAAAAGRGASAVAAALPGVQRARALLEAARRTVLAVIRFPPYLSAPAAAGILARALRSGPRIGARAFPSGQARGFDDDGLDRRILAVARAPRGNSPGELPLLEAMSRIEAVLPRGARFGAIKDEGGSVSHLLMTSAASVSPRDLREALRRAAESSGISIGVSDRLPPGESWDRILVQSSEALELGTALLGPGHVSYYSNLYLYKAFIDDGRPELFLSFSRSTLDRIRAWDEAHSGQLLRTLETYFGLDRNLRRTAATLGIHRQTVKNRIAKIEELTACPMADEGRMSYELMLAYKHLSKVKL